MTDRKTRLRMLWRGGFALCCASLAYSQGEPLPESTSEQRRFFRAFVPIPAAFYTPETGVGGGVGIVAAYREDDAPSSLRDSNIVPVILYTEKKQTIVRTIWDHYAAKGLYHALAKFGYTDYPDRFYGIGNNTDAEDYEHFTETYHNVDLDFERLIHENLYAGLAVRYDKFQIRHRDPKGRLVNENISGADSGRIVGAGINLIYNSRDNVFSPNVGSKHELAVLSYPSALGGDYSFQQRSLRTRFYLPIRPGYSLVALELQGQDLEGNVPFRKLALLGGQFNLRGYYLGRFRDKKALHAQVAYRRYFAKRWSYTVFLASGAVAEEWGTWFEQKQHISWGAGLRYVINLETGINFRMDYGRGSDGRGFYVGVGEAF